MCAPRAPHVLSEAHPRELQGTGSKMFTVKHQLSLSNLIPVAVGAAVGVVVLELWKWGRREQSKKVSFAYGKCPEPCTCDLRFRSPDMTSGSQRCCWCATSGTGFSVLFVAYL